MGSITSSSSVDSSPSPKKLKVSPFDAQDFDWPTFLPNISKFLQYDDCHAAKAASKTWLACFPQKIFINTAIETLVGKMMLHRITHNQYDTFLVIPTAPNTGKQHDKTWKRCIDAMEFIKGRTEMGDSTAHLAVSILADFFNLNRRNLTRAETQQFYSLLDHPHLLTFVVCFIASKAEDVQKLYPSHANLIFDSPVPADVILGMEVSLMQLLEDWLPIDYYGRYIIRLKSIGVKSFQHRSDRVAYLQSVNHVLSTFVRAMETHHNAYTAPPFMIAVCIVLYAFLLSCKGDTKTPHLFLHALLALDAHYEYKEPFLAIRVNNIVWMHIEHMQFNYISKSCIQDIHTFIRKKLIAMYSYEPNTNAFNQVYENGHRQ